LEYLHADGKMKSDANRASCLSLGLKDYEQVGNERTGQTKAARS
jgi:hypothetical protein